MQRVEALPSKLDLLLKASSLSRVALAQQMGVDKSLVGKAAISTKRWHHLALVRDGDSTTVYLDARRQGELSGAIKRGAPFEGQLYFAGYGDASGHFEGKLDDIAVFHRALTAAEVSGHFKAAGSAAASESGGD